MKQLSLVVMLLALAGCATVIHGTKQNFGLDSQPAGAVATLSNGQACTTPCSLKVPRKHGFDVVFSKDGYRPFETSVASTLDPWPVAGNILIGGLVGIGVDFIDGASNGLEPGRLLVALARLHNPTMPTALSTMALKYEPQQAGLSCYAASLVPADYVIQGGRLIDVASRGCD